MKKILTIIYLLGLVSLQLLAQGSLRSEWLVNTQNNAFHTLLIEAYTEVAVDPAGNSFVLSTFSDSIVLPTGVLQSKGKDDVMLLKIDNTGQIIWSLQLGGSDSDYGYGVTYSSSGIFVHGKTLSTDFPVTSGAFIESKSAGEDGFVLSIQDNGSSGEISYGTYLGGSGNDEVGDLAIFNGYIYLIGTTNSVDFTITFPAFSTTSNGGTDMFVTKMDTELSGVFFSTYLGGNDEDKGRSLRVTSDGKIYFAGTTRSQDFPVSADAFDLNYNGSQDIVVGSLDTTGSSLISGSYFGGSSKDELGDITLLKDGKLVFVGHTESVDYPVSQNAHKQTWESIDGCITVLDSSFGQVIYSGYIGGNNLDLAYDVETTSENGILIVGETYSTDFLSAEESDSGNVFIARLDVGDMTLSHYRMGKDDATEIPHVSVVKGESEDLILAGMFHGRLIFDDTLTNSKNQRTDLFVLSLTSCFDSSCVWPGDVDRNAQVDVWDVLPIGVGFNEAGIVRGDTGVFWQGYAAPLWLDNLTNPKNFIEGQNYRHADCNGNGVIYSEDADAISRNYSRVRYKTENENNVDADISLELNIPGDTIISGSTINVPITLGEALAPVDSAYGIAFSVSFDPSLVDSVFVDLDSSWLGKVNVDLIHLHKIFLEDGQVDIGMTRIDHKNVSGFGEVGTLGFVMVENIAGKLNKEVPFVLTINRATLISAEGAEQPVNAVADSVVISGYNNNGIDPEIPKVRLFPNPIRSFVNVSVSDDMIGNVKLYNSAGVLIYHDHINKSKARLNLDRFDTGIYLFETELSSGMTYHQRLIVIK